MNRAEKKADSINNSQKALLHTARRALGLDDETYREMLFNVAGVRSSVDLTLPKFQAVMMHLEECGFKKNHADHEFTGYMANLQKWKRTAGERPGMATPAQLARIETDWHLMPWFWSKDGFGNETLALRGFLKRCTGASDLMFLRFSQAHKTIEAIKSISTRSPNEKEERK
jgi:hypothetical protein